MKTVILGGGGFLGSHICEALLQNNHDVTIFDLPSATYLEYCSKLGAKIITGNFLESDRIQKALDQGNVIYHLISTTVPKTSNEDPQYDIRTNVIGFLNILKDEKLLKNKNFIFSSSGGTVYGIPNQVPIPETHPTNPICSYGIHKLIIEKYLNLFNKLYDLDYCILRVGNAYGPRQPKAGPQGVIGTFLSKAIQDEEIVVWGDGSVIRDYTYVSDIAEAFVKAGEYQGKPKLFNIGSGKGHSINDILEMILEIVDVPIKVKYVEGRFFDVPSNVLDISLAKTFLNWVPKTNLFNGIKQTYHYSNGQTNIN